jgi:CheY-like chemotaxis protein
MAFEFEFISPDDRPALVALSNAEYITAAQLVLGELGYKVHTVGSHEEFATQFAQIQYHVVLLEEAFGGNDISENLTLINLQLMPMAQRRHAVILLVGPSFQSLSSLQAFQQSVQAVLNPAELGSLAHVVQKIVSDHDILCHVYRASQRRLAEGRL